MTNDDNVAEIDLVAISIGHSRWVAVGPLKADFYSYWRLSLRDLLPRLFQQGS